MPKRKKAVIIRDTPDRFVIPEGGTVKKNLTIFERLKVSLDRMQKVW